MVRQLLEAGSDASLADSGNRTPLSFAARQGNETIISLLLSAGARSEGTVGSSTCPLAVAAQGGHQGVVRLLLQDECDVVGGLTAIWVALAVALQAGRARVLNLQLSMVTSSSWETFLEVTTKMAEVTWESYPFTLHRAAALGNLAIIGVLLAAGMDEANKDKVGTSAFDVAGVDAPEEKKGRELQAAIRRVLRRGPAFRARSWAWPVNTHAAGGHDGMEACSAGQSLRAPRLHVSIYRAKSSACFGRLVGR